MAAADPHAVNEDHASLWRAFCASRRRERHDFFGGVAFGSLRFLLSWSGEGWALGGEKAALAQQHVHDQAGRRAH
eukprot:scaffold68733_cov26-Tisochrysis_lutea.AAC.1